MIIRTKQVIIRSKGKYFYHTFVCCLIFCLFIYFPLMFSVVSLSHLEADLLLLKK